jgi:hypothetical protein
MTYDHNWFFPMIRVRINSAFQGGVNQAKPQGALALKDSVRIT